MAAEAEAIELGLVVRTLAMYEHAVGLARGVTDPRAREAATVSRENMVAAHAVADEVKRQIDHWHGRANRVRWPPVLAVTAQRLVDSAAHAAKRLESELRQILGSTAPSAASVRSLHGGWPQIWVSWMALAQEPLEIIAGERPLEGSTIAMAGDEITHGILVSIPILGTAIMVFEAVTGRDVVNWRKLSGTERVFSVLAAVLPLVSGWVLGAAARTVGRGVVITKRAIAVAVANSRFASALVNIAGARVVFQLALGLRILPKKDFLEFLTLLRAPSMSAAQAQRFNFYLTRIDYVWRSATWLKIAKQQGKLKPGWNPLNTVNVEPNEPQALEALAKLTNKPVVSLPKAMPELYQQAAKARGLKEMSGAKYPDGLLESELFDLWVAETNSMTTALGKISDKGLQANTVAVYLGGSKTTLTMEGVAGQLHRIWANPRNMYIDRIILYTSTTIKEYARPTAFIALPGGIGFARSKLPPGEERIKAAEEVDAEPDPQPPKK